VNKKGADSSTNKWNDINKSLAWVELFAVRLNNPIHYCFLNKMHMHQMVQYCKTNSELKRNWYKNALISPICTRHKYLIQVLKGITCAIDLDEKYRNNPCVLN
jgi:hypothetical protein